MIIPVTNAGSQSNDNFTIFSHSSMISIPLDVRKDVDNEIIKKIASNDIIKEKIAAQEKKLLDHPLEHNDLNSTNVESVYSILKNEGKTNEKSLIVSNGVNISEGSFLEFGVDRKIRIFSPDGTQLFISNDIESEKVKISSNTMIPMTHSISVPSGATITNQGDNVHITYKGQLLLTIAKQPRNIEVKNSRLNNSQTEYPVSSQEENFLPSNTGPSWIAWAEYKPNTELKSYSADWIIPHSPSAPPNNDLPENIIFNGVEPSDGSIIVQPVSAFNFVDFSHDSINWRNNWFGSAYIVRPTYPYSIHSSPIALSEGDAVNGFIYYIPETNEWIVILTDNGQTTQKSSYLFCNFNPNNVNLVTTYEAYFNETRTGASPNFPIPSNQAKTGDIHFYNTVAWDTNLQEIPITWISKYNIETIFHPGLSGIFVDNTTQAPSHVTIYTNYTPPNILAPVAGFYSPSQTSGTAPIAVSNYDASTNNPTSYSWNFGDGQTSTQKNPVHMYALPGVYTVSLTATNGAGSDTKIRSNYVSANSPPPSQRIVNGECNNLTGWTTSGSDSSGGQGYPAEPVSSGGQDGGGYLELKAFGDPYLIGNHGNAESLMYQDVDLTNVITVTYYLKSQIIASSGSTSHFEVYLDGTQKLARTGAISTWQQFSFPVSGLTGVHRIRFDAYTSNGGKIWADVDSVSAIAQIASPNSSFTAPQTSGTTPFTVSFTDTSTNTPSAWAWDFGDNSTSVAQSPSHNYTTSGNYTVKLTVANTAGNNTITKFNYISSNPKMYTIISSAGPGGLIGPSGTVNVLEGDSKTYTIQPNFSFATDLVLVDGNNVTIQGMSYTFPDVHANHTISATFKSIPAPLANFTATPHTGPANLSVAFTDTSTGSPTIQFWNFGDNNFTGPWTQMTASAGWSHRNSPVSVTLPDGSIVLMGGFDSTIGEKNDVWQSTDNGLTWMQKTPGAGWTGREGHSAVTMPDGSIVLMGGFDNTIGPRNDVWKSTDKGATWTQVIGSAGWTPRYLQTSVVMPDGSIVLMGGYDNTTGWMHDVWRSTNSGATWTRMNATAAWTARYLHSSVAMPDGSIVLMGGCDETSTYKNDVWRSTDNGATWTQVNASAGWTPRVSHSTVAMPDGSIVLTGGYEATSSGSKASSDSLISVSRSTAATWAKVNATAGWAPVSKVSVVKPVGGMILTDSLVYSSKNDVWRSTNNGATWTRVNASAGWTPRYTHSTVAVPDGSIILMGGFDNTVGERNDVWRLIFWGSSLQNPTHSYATNGTYSVSLTVTGPGGTNITKKNGYICVGDCKENIGVFRDSTHLFYLDYNGNGAWNGGVVDRSYNFGISGDLPVAGDWNGDGITEIGVYRNSTRTFYLDYNGNGAWNLAPIDRSFTYGSTGDLPLSGDWNNDGVYEIGVYRPSNHTFYLDYNGNGLLESPPADRSYPNFSTTGDIPVSGDWNNDGVSEICVFRPSTHLFYLDYNGNGVWNGAVTDRQYNFGLTGDLPVSGDWNNDGISEIGIFRPSTHMFYLDYNGNGVWNGGVIDRQYTFGLTGDLPVSGKWGG
jgi:PKD repeat protein